MGLPDADKAEISEEKIVRYLLSSTHRAGRSKAPFFAKHGFAAESWRVLADALRRHASAGTVTAVENTRYGTRYVVVWFINIGTSVPRFATAHPLKRKAHDQRT